MTYPSNPQEYPQTGPGGQPGYQSGYPAQPGYQGAYPPQAPYPQQGAYPQQGQYPPAYAPQPPYPPQQGYAQPGYPPQQAQAPGYPPAAYGQPYAQVPMQGAQVRPKARNPLASRALIYGALTLGANIVGLFLHFFLTGILAVLTIYYAIRALAYAGKLPGKEGTGMAIGGLVLALLSLAITIIGYASNFH